MGLGIQLCYTRAVVTAAELGGPVCATGLTTYKSFIPFHPRMDKIMSGSTATLLVVFLIGILIVPAVEAIAEVVFSDDTFSDSDWYLDVYEHGYGGTVVAVQVASGGNNGNYRRVDQTVYEAPPGDTSWVCGYHGNPGFVFDPQTQDSFVQIDFSIDYKNLDDCPIWGDGQAFGLAIKQDGNVYVKYYVSGTVTQWTHYSVFGLVETDFSIVDETIGFDPARNPDFSTDGLPVEVGFFTSNGTPTASYTKCVGYDNLSVVVHGIVTEINDFEAYPRICRLYSYPNPFNPRTAVGFVVPSQGHVQLAVYDLRGRLTRVLVAEHRAAGNHTATWDGRDAEDRRVASGTYFCRLTAAGESVVSKMVMVQ